MRSGPTVHASPSQSEICVTFVPPAARRASDRPTRRLPRGDTRARRARGDRRREEVERFHGLSERPLLRDRFAEPAHRRETGRGRGHGRGRRAARGAPPRAERVGVLHLAAALLILAHASGKIGVERLGVQPAVKRRQRRRVPETATVAVRAACISVDAGATCPQRTKNTGKHLPTVVWCP